MTVFSYLTLCLIWGSTWLVIRIGLADMPPLWSLAIRLVPALAFLGVLVWHQKPSFREAASRPWRLLQVSLLTYPISYGLVYWGEQYITSGMAAVVFAVMPFFVALFSWWLLPAERLRPIAFVGLLMGFGGLSIVYWEELDFGNLEKTWGMLAVTASSFLAAFNTVTVRRWLSDVPAVTMATLTTVVGAILVPLMALAGAPLSTDQFTVRSMGAALYLGVAGSGLSFVLYYRLLSRLPALSMSLIAFLTPIVALTLGHFLDYEVRSLRSWSGVALVLLGVLLTLRGVGHTKVKKADRD